MATNIFNCGLQFIFSNGLSAADLRVLLLMTNTDADTANDSITNTDDLTLDEMDGANYVRKALENESITRDDANDRSELDADDVVWTALGNGTRAMQGFLVHNHNTGDSASTPIFFQDFSSNVNPAGLNFTLAWNAEGIMQLAAA